MEVVVCCCLVHCCSVFTNQARKGVVLLLNNAKQSTCRSRPQRCYSLSSRCSNLYTMFLCVRGRWQQQLLPASKDDTVENMLRKTQNYLYLMKRGFYWIFPLFFTMVHRMKSLKNECPSKKSSFSIRNTLVQCKMSKIRQKCRGKWGILN